MDLLDSNRKWLFMNRILLTRIRGAFASAVLVGLLAGCAHVPQEHGRASATAAPSTGVPATIILSDQLQQLESEHAARIGVSAFDTATGQTVSYRADERFGYASTIKAFVAAAFLSKIPAISRDAVVTWTQDDVDAAGYSPVTSGHLRDGLSLNQLTEAAVRSSDNTATNIILEKIGGPAGVEETLRHAGDMATELVNYEPALNIVESSSTDNTTTPAAFTASLHSVLMGTTLNETDKETLMDWMGDNTTGDSLIRAGAPDGWTVSDKSGGANGIRNDIAIITPPGRAPIIVTILTVKNDPHAQYEDRTVSDTAAALLRTFT
jgi:beta-lactamase class A